MTRQGGEHGQPVDPRPPRAVVVRRHGGAFDARARASICGPRGCQHRRAHARTTSRLRLARLGGADRRPARGGERHSARMSAGTASAWHLQSATTVPTSRRAFRRPTPPPPHARGSTRTSFCSSWTRPPVSSPSILSPLIGTTNDYAIVFRQQADGVDVDRRRRDRRRRRLEGRRLERRVCVVEPHRRQCRCDGLGRARACRCVDRGSESGRRQRLGRRRHPGEHRGRHHDARRTRPLAEAAREEGRFRNAA